MGSKVIIDCDPGVDDALALILAFHSPELEVEAITGVNGNVPIELVMQNIKKILSLIRPAHRPWIGQGAARPLIGEAVNAYDVHGYDGLGGARIESSEGEDFWHFSSEPAEEIILEMASKYPEELTLIAIGPLTNLALAIKKDPRPIKKIRKIIIMGGAVRGKGNITPFAEFNFYVDPLAAQMVMEAELPIIIIPLDVTHQVFLTAEEMEKRGSGEDNLFIKFLLESSGYDYERRVFRGAKKLFYLHDPLAIAVAVQDQLIEKEKISISVNTAQGLYYGQVRELPATGANFASQIEVALKVKREGFLNFFWKRLRG